MTTQPLSAEVAAYIARAIGPQQVGGRYRNGYWGEEYTVLAVEPRRADWMAWSVTVATDEEAARGASRTHCTPWDPKRDQVIAQPERSGRREETPMYYIDDECVFCQRIRTPGGIELDRGAVVAFTPLNPVVPGHRLFVPVRHVPNALTEPRLTAEVMRVAAQESGDECNIITSVGPNATQTVFHLHVHVVPRAAGDGLTLPWTGQQERMAALTARPSK